MIDCAWVMAERGNCCIVGEYGSTGVWREGQAIATNSWANGLSVLSLNG